MAQPIAPIPLIAPPRPSLLEAVAAAKADFGDLSKDSDNPYLKSKFLGLPGLLRAVEPALLDQGIVIYSQMLCDQGNWVMRTTLAFKDGLEELSSDFPVNDMTTMHKTAGHVKYGVRYNLFALLNICPEADDDGNSVVYSGEKPSSTQLPGLPTPGSWPAPGQQVQHPQAVFSQPLTTGYQPQPPMAPNYATTPQGYPVISTMPPGMVNPVQPLPVLSQPS
jgi:hypothetical protein